MLQKNVTLQQNELIRKDEIVKTLLETKTSILETVSKPSVEEEKEEEEVSSTRNEIIEEMQWQKNHLVKRIQTSLKTYTLKMLDFDTKITLFDYLI